MELQQFFKITVLGDQMHTTLFALLSLRWDRVV